MKAKIEVSQSFKIGAIEKELWGSFIEHMGRAVYGGIYEPGHPEADENGFRKDVLRLIRELSVPILRYPGGNFLSGYDWKDGIGKNRKRKLDLAWGQTEPNEVGVHEFAEFAKKAGSEVMMSVNMGTAGPKEAAELVEYCNHPGGSCFSDLRAENGNKLPFGIERWCIGNEMDGDWQICHLTADEYGKKAAEAAKLMRWVDGGIKLVLCGSSSPDMATYPEWDRKVLEYAFDYVDYLSLHRYYTYTDSGTEDDFITAYADLDSFIKTAAATIDYVSALKRSRKKVWLSVDEWNIWHQKNIEGKTEVYDGEPGDRWSVGPKRVENVYDYADALCFAGLVITLINNADRVKMGCLAQLVNVIAPILTQNGGKAIKQSIYFPYLTAIKEARGTALRTAVSAPETDTARGTLPVLHVAAVENPEGGVTLFVLNRSSETVETESVFGEKLTLRKTQRLIGKGLHSKNTFDNPDVIGLVEKAENGAAAQSHSLKIEPYSYSVYKFTRETK